MIIVLSIIFIVIVIVGACLLDSYNYETLGGVSLTVGIIGLVVSLVSLVVLTGEVVNASSIDDRIAMYETENAKIESQIVEVVKQYQQYEKEIFAEVTPDSAMTLVSLYPELKSDALVVKQIEVYIGNNEKIKSLKEEKIVVSVKKWWLYFGGEQDG